MKRNIFWAGALLVLTTAGMLLAPASVEAQRGRGYRAPRGNVWVNPYRGTYFSYGRGYYAPRYGSYYRYPRYYGANSYWYPRSYYGAGYWPNYLGTTYWPNTYSYSYSPAQTIYETPVVADSTAHFDVHVPTPDAQVWINGRLTSQTGMERRFDSPPLQSGHRYSYEFRVRWTDNGVTQEQRRNVAFGPGETERIDFTAAASY